MKRIPRLFWEWLGVFLACAALCAYFQFQTPYLPEEDGYFHIKMAWLLRHHGWFTGGFPWASLSLWRDGFSDGSPLFHLLLIPFTFGDLAFGAKLATILFSAFMFSSFFAILTLNGVRARFYWFWLLLLGGGFFWWRMLVPRPQVLSTILLLWSVHFLINGRLRPFAALSFLYPLSYVAAFLPQVFAAVRWAYLRLAARRSEHRIVLAGLGAFAAAMLVHPYFPKNLMNFYVVNGYLMTLAWTNKVNLFLGEELLPLDTRQLLTAHLPLIANLSGVSFLFMHRRTPLSERTRVLFLIAAIAGVLTCASKRFVEYSVPLATLFCAFFFTDACAGDSRDDFARDYGAAGTAALLGGFLAMGAATAVGAGAVRENFRRVEPPRFRALAQAVAAQAPPGELVYACDWDEPPELLFYDDRHRYPVLLDPTYMYYWNPAVWRKWGDLSNGRLTPNDTVRALTDVFHARYGVCGRKFFPLRRLIGADPRFRLIAEDANGYAFEVLSQTCPRKK